MCSQNEEGLADTVEPLARGNSNSVAALFNAAHPFDIIVHNHPSGDLRPSDADVLVASQFGNNSIGSIIVNNDVSDCYVLVEPFSPQHVEALDVGEVASVFDEKGVLAQRLRGFEKRESQIEMARQIAGAFNEEKILMVEAGTGTGKSLAYLVPAIKWAITNKQKVVISTNTINLQEQLIKKDIPFLAEHTDLIFTAELIKGRSNYLCRKKLSEASLLQEDLFDSQELKQEKHIRAWAEKTSEGVVSELNFVPPEDLWERFCSEQDICLKVKCPCYHDCYYYAARRRSSAADLIIVNHHLLFSDLSLKQDMPDTMGAILPPFKYLIVDEAHHIEDVASSHFGYSISKFGLIKLLGRLQHSRHRGRGMLPEMVQRLTRAGNNLDDQVMIQKLVDHINQELIPLRNTVLVSVSQIFEGLETDLVLLCVQCKKSEHENTIRITEEIRSSEQWRTSIKPKMASLQKELAGFNKKLKETAKLLDQLEGALQKEIEFSLLTVKGLIRRLDEYVKKITILLNHEEDGLVFWFEWTRKSGALSCRAIPLEVAPILAEAVYNAHKTVVLTSATLTIEKKFDFLAGRVGLDLVDRKRMVFSLLQSPFMYDRQVLFGVPADMPEPDDRRFTGELTGTLRELISATEGRAFVLFTSYRLLDTMYTELEASLNEQSITPLRQGSMNRHYLLEQFKHDINSCLFATDSFWEGVDVVGESLSSVIITRLPFKVPTDPLHEARAELLRSQGRDPFSDYMVPLAILKFRQGIGRLIRHRSDRGVITILDRRIISKPYGKKFLRSLFVSTPHIENRERLYQRIREFITAPRQ